MRSVLFGELNFNVIGLKICCADYSVFTSQGAAEVGWLLKEHLKEKLLLPFVGL